MTIDRFEFLFPKRYKKMLRYLLLAVVTLCLFSCRPDKTPVPDNVRDIVTTADSISEALDYQMSTYPVSQYRDVYKNFMQDFFGPGHILSDTAKSGKYLRSELMEDGCFGGPLYEKTGYKGNFYRVNLSLVRDGVIPYDVFFNTFVESIQGIVPPSGKEWMSTWNMIDSVITSKGLKFIDEDIDRKALSGRFEKGDYVAHHSQRFNDSVKFHYRIISKEKFEKIIYPLIQERGK